MSRIAPACASYVQSTIFMAAPGSLLCPESCAKSGGALALGGRGAHQPRLGAAASEVGGALQPERGLRLVARHRDAFLVGDAQEVAHLHPAVADAFPRGLAAALDDQ